MLYIDPVQPLTHLSGGVQKVEIKGLGRETELTRKSGKQTRLQET